MTILPLESNEIVEGLLAKNFMRHKCRELRYHRSLRDFIHINKLAPVHLHQIVLHPPTLKAHQWLLKHHNYLVRPHLKPAI